jgi:antitoxin FitA
MSGTMVQVRNVPPELHRRLKARAAIEGLSMSEFVMRELRKALDRPTRQEVLERLRARPVRRLRRRPADVVRAERDSR